MGLAGCRGGRRGGGARGVGKAVEGVGGRARKVLLLLLFFVVVVVVYLFALSFLWVCLFVFVVLFVGLLVSVSWEGERGAILTVLIASCRRGKKGKKKKKRK